MAEALGFRLLDDADEPLPPGGAALRKLARIETAAAHPLLAEATVRVACDVDNPLCGPNGASAVYGPQKGATSEMVSALDEALAHYADIVADVMGRDVRDVPGAGAAGGLGAGLLAFAHATLEPGAPLIAEAVGLPEALGQADLVVTGEGKLDAQTLSGKVVAHVAALARQVGVPCATIAGMVEGDRDALCESLDLTTTLELMQPGEDVATSMAQVKPRLEAAGEELASCLRP